MRKEAAGGPGHEGPNKKGCVPPPQNWTCSPHQGEQGHQPLGGMPSTGRISC